MGSYPLGKRGKRPPKPLKFFRLPTGCWVCYSHKPNHDGYIRINRGGKLVMLHRMVLEASGVAIPPGFEVDHECNNRPCCAREHLTVLRRADHLQQSNKDRSAGRIAAARSYWLEHPGISGTALATKFGATTSTGCRWLTLWEKEKWLMENE